MLRFLYVDARGYLDLSKSIIAYNLIVCVELRFKNSSAAE